MAYAALVSLNQTIERLRYASRILILLPSPEITELVYEIRSLQEFLVRLDSSSGDRVDAFDGQIREAVCKLEDTLESHVSNQFLSQSEESLGDEGCSLTLSVDLIEEVKQEVNTFTQRVKEMKEMFLEDVFSPLLEEDDAVSSRIDYRGNKSKVVGLSREIGIIKYLLSEQWSTELKTLSIFGMAGIGKTTLAKEIFKHPSILSRFDGLAWVNVGPKCSLKEIMLGILAQTDPEIDIMLAEGDGKLAENLHRSLENRRYLIVLDDIWSEHVRDELRSLLPDDNNGSRVLLTTRLNEVALCGGILEAHGKYILNKEESWYLLREVVFAEELCPPQLEKAGKKIAENCESLPLNNRHGC